MNDQKKIGVDPQTHKLVGDIAEAENRSMAGQVKHWAKKDAKRLSIGSKIVPKQQIPKQPDFTDSANVNTNEVADNDAN